MVCGPAVRAAVVRLAPPWASREALPRTVLPSRKATGPVGVPAPGLSTVTAAVKVTACPYTGVSSDDVTAGVGGARLATSGTIAPLTLKLVSPPYHAVTE